MEPGDNRDLNSFTTVSCSIEPANATVQTRWVLPCGQIISQSSGRYKIGSGGDGNGSLYTLLLIGDVSYQDAGFYTCEVVPRSVSRSLCECVDFPFSATTELRLQGESRDVYHFQLK